MAKFTAKERRHQRHAANAGGLAGLVGGGYAGVKAGQQASKIPRVASGAGAAYRGSRALGSGRAGAAARIPAAAGAALRGPRTRGSFAPLYGGYLGAVTGGVGAAAASQAHVTRQQMKRKEQVGKSKRIMSDAEIRRRKKAQGTVSQVTGGLGLASVGAFGASKLPGAKFLTKTPRLRRLGASKAMNKINPKKAKDAALGLSTAGAGIGGAGSFNFAAYTDAEGRKRKLQPVTKRDGVSAFGVVHD